MHRLHVFVIALAAAALIYESPCCFTRSTALASDSPAGSVSPASPMLEPRSGHTATLLQDGKVLIAGGMRRNQDFYSSAELFDPATGKFQATGAMSVARVGHAAVLLRSGKVLIGGDGWAAAARTPPNSTIRDGQIHGTLENDRQTRTAERYAARQRRRSHRGRR